MSWYCEESCPKNSVTPIMHCPYRNKKYFLIICGICATDSQINFDLSLPVSFVKIYYKGILYSQLFIKHGYVENYFNKEERLYITSTDIMKIGQMISDWRMITVDRHNLGNHGIYLDE